ncbi:MAG: winged helix DNA-binding domain-containing protein [Rhodobacteraceae bacterium]|nr:winged helix DNA-binding domain-containing protein [Paracoccaceae bacterium]
MVETGPLRISNKDARRLWLHSHGLTAPPTGPLDVMATIKALGFVQIDSVRNVTRAHHHILWSRNRNYRESHLWPLLKSRQLFEHFTHDASLIPMDTLPMWQRQFTRMGKYVANSEWFASNLGQQNIKDIKARIQAEGPLSTHAFSSELDAESKTWARPPHKRALDKMWYAGELATSRRENFVKFYDVAERVFPEHLREDLRPEAVQINWLCTEALHRLGFGSSREIARFWDAVTLNEARAWVAGLREVEVEAADGSLTKAFAAPDITQRLAQTPRLSAHLRIINPFDPAIRDRVRLERLFGFAYRNEMFVPKAKRQWGYYVYPLLEGARFVGRIELKADRKAGWLKVVGFWPEAGIKWGKSRREKLEMELTRLARFVGLETIEWHA